MNPAELLCDDIEFFSSPNDRDICYALTGLQIYRVKNLPAHIKDVVWAEIKRNPAKIQWYIALGYTGPDALIEKYCSCNFGTYDGKADYSNGIFYYDEYVPCPTRHICDANGKGCNRFVVGNGHALTDREVMILHLVGRCLLNKEIAEELGISPETVKIHIKHTQVKAGLMNKKDLVLLAHQKQLV